MTSRYKKFPNDKMYMRQWRKDNPGYYKYGPGYVNGKLKQRYCKECNVEVGRGKHRCPECMIIHRRARNKATYKYTPELAAKLKKWREANPDKCKEYAERSKQREWDKKGPKLCRRCNIEIKRTKQFCPTCYPIHMEEQKKRHNDEQAGYRKQRYENRDRDAYNAYYRNYFKKNRDKVLYIQKKFQERKKQSWYKSRLEKIEKLKGCLEMNK